MNSKRIEGIDNVLGHLLSPPKEVSVQQQSTRKEPLQVRRISLSSSQRDKSSNARLGRPLGKQVKRESPAEKVTVRISKALIDQYRDWSWEARCSLSGLVERAMIEHQRRSNR